MRRPRPANSTPAHAAPGLQEALSPSYRGGVYGRIIEGGRVEIGSPVSLE